MSALSLTEASAVSNAGLVSGPGFWLAVAGVALGSFALRAVFIYAMERITVSDTLRLVLSYIPAAVLAALVAPAIVLHKGALTFPLDWLSGRERLLAGLVAISVALWRRSMVLTILTGMAALYILNSLWG